MTTVPDEHLWQAEQEALNFVPYFLARHCP